jgi:predicted PurR-regulated permease PerM
MISLSTVVTLVVYILVAGLIFWLLYWLVNFINPPEPFKKIATVVLAVLGVLIIIGILLSLIGGTPLIRMNNRAPIFQNRIVTEKLNTIRLTVLTYKPEISFQDIPLSILNIVASATRYSLAKSRCLSPLLNLSIISGISSGDNLHICRLRGLPL